MSRTRSTSTDRILDVAADLFATRPFHEVKLEDIAARARVGKGTMYLYWSSKEDVYLAIIRRGFAAVLARVDAELESHTGSPWEKLDAIVTALIDFAFSYPQVYRIMRSGTLTPEDPALQKVRAELIKRIVKLLKQGRASGELHDPNPALTAQYMLSFVRGALLYPPSGLTRRSLKKHILHVLGSGILRGGKK